MKLFKKVTSMFTRKSCEMKIESLPVYWVEKGKTYHTRRDCPTLIKSQNVKEGLKVDCPKENMCELCKAK